MIFLTSDELVYLAKLIKKDETPFWIKDKVLDKLNEQVQEWERIKACTHTFGKYNLVEDRCTLCGTIPVGGSLTSELAG